MKAEELMVGDWVILYDRPRKVEIVYDNNRVQVGCIEEDCTVLEPIPLTPEILEKNANGGWCNYQSEPKGRSIYHIGEVAVYVEWERIVPSPYIELHGLGDTFFKGYVDYVHELQHALKLCRINLEIKL